VRPPLEISPTLEKWLKDTVGISRSLLDSLDADDDWTFVIKMHGILEAALNHLLLARLDNPSLTRIISRLETSNARTGKLAFIKAYGLLEDNACLFVQTLSEIRNSAVHDVKNFDLTLQKYLARLDSQQLKNWKTAMTSWMSSTPSETVRNITISHPREAIFNCCMIIMITSFAAQLKADAFRKLLQTLDVTR
jgi:hypothetical protein